MGNGRSSGEEKGFLGLLVNSLRLVYSNDRVAALGKQGERQEVEEVEVVGFNRLCGVFHVTWSGYGPWRALQGWKGKLIGEATAVIVLHISTTIMYPAHSLHFLRNAKCLQTSVRLPPRR